MSRTECPGWTRWPFPNRRGAIEAEIAEADFRAERGRVAPPLRTREELAYYRIFRQHLAGVSPERTLSHFATA